MEKIALLMAGIVFFVVSTFHLARVFLRLEVRIGIFTVPLWFSIIGFIFSLSLSIFMLTSIK